jgi:hypothetical protein
MTYVWRIRALFLGVVLAVPAYVLTRYGEPYPSLLMPSFGGAFTSASGLYEMPHSLVIVRFTSGEEKSLSPNALFDPVVPLAFRHSIIRMNFYPRTEPPATSRPITQRWFPGRVRRNAKPLAEIDPESIAWLRQRLRVLFPGRVAQECDFVWLLTSFSYSHDALQRQGTRELARRTVSL